MRRASGQPWMGAVEAPPSPASVPRPKHCCPSKTPSWATWSQTWASMGWLSTDLVMKSCGSALKVQLSIWLRPWNPVAPCQRGSIRISSSRRPSMRLSVSALSRTCSPMTPSKRIIVDGVDRILVSRSGTISGANSGFSSEDVFRRVVDRLVAPTGVVISDRNPLVNVRLRDGALLSIVLPPVSTRGPCLTLRKPSNRGEDSQGSRGSGDAQFCDVKFPRYLSGCTQERLDLWGPKLWQGFRFGRAGLRCPRARAHGLGRRGEQPENWPSSLDCPGNTVRRRQWDFNHWRRGAPSQRHSDAS